MKRINQINYSPVYDEEKRRYENTFFLEFVCLLFTECKVSFPSWKFHAKNQNTISFYSVQFREYNSVSTCCSLLDVYNIHLFFAGWFISFFCMKIQNFFEPDMANGRFFSNELRNLYVKTIWSCYRISSEHDFPWPLWL